MAIEVVEPAYMFRPYNSTDIPFIQSSWGSSYYKGSYFHELLSPDEFHQRHRPIREGFFSKPNAAVIVCCSKEDEAHILAWIAIEKIETSTAIIVHYIYVKQAFKDEGLASELLSRALPKEYKPILFTHLTEKAERILKHNPERYEEFHFIPHLT